MADPVFPITPSTEPLANILVKNVMFDSDVLDTFLSYDPAKTYTRFVFDDQGKPVPVANTEGKAMYKTAEITGAQLRKAVALVMTYKAINHLGIEGKKLRAEAVAMQDKNLKKGDPEFDALDAKASALETKVQDITKAFNLEVYGTETAPQDPIKKKAGINKVKEAYTTMQSEAAYRAKDTPVSEKPIGMIKIPEFDAPESTFASLLPHHEKQKMSEALQGFQGAMLFDAGQSNPNFALPKKQADAKQGMKPKNTTAALV